MKPSKASIKNENEICIFNMIDERLIITLSKFPD